MRSRKRKGFFGVVFLFLAAIIVVVVAVVSVNLRPSVPPVQKELPKMIVYLDGVTLAEIYENGKEIKYPGNDLQVVMGDGELDFTDVEIKGRGNATWGQVKKPLQLKLKQKADLLGLGKRRKWILLTSYWDDTNLRTDTAFYLSNMVGEKFAHRGDFVELYVDGEYEGLYYLTQGIEVGKNAVDLRDSLGVLVELDNIYCQREELYFTTDNGECFTVKDTVAEDNLELAMEDFIDSFNQLEMAVRAEDYAKINEVIDVESFAQYYLVSEFTANPDAYYTSQYFYKDGVRDKIHAGPVWDFDIALNNTKIREYVAPDDNMTANIPKEYFKNSDEQYSQWSRLFARLIEIPEFKAEVDMVFQERMSGRKDEFLGHIFKRAARIYNAAAKEDEKWEKGDFVRAVKDLLEWASDRYDYFEQEYGTKRYQNYPAYDINVIEV